MRKTIKQLEEELKTARAARADAETRLNAIKEFLVKTTKNDTYSAYGSPSKSAFELLNELAVSRASALARVNVLGDQLTFYSHLIRVYANDFTLKIETEAKLKLNDHNNSPNHFNND